MSEKIEIKLREEDTWTDITDYIINGSFITITRGNRLSTGSIILDINYTDIVSRRVRVNDSIRYTIGESTADTVVLSGFFVKPIDSNNTNTWEISDGGKLAMDRSFTGVLSETVGTGDQVVAAKLIIDEEITELGYDDTTIPDKTETIADIKTKRYQNKNCYELLTIVAGQINRILFFDEDLKVNMINETFTETGFLLSELTNTIGDLIIGTDVTSWGNYLIIDGKENTVGWTQSEAVGSTVYDLDFVFESVSAVVSGVSKRIAFTGSEFESGADAIFDQSGKTLTFNSTTTGTGDVVITGFFTERVHYEDQDSGSRAEFGRKDFRIIEDGIETQAQAQEISDNFLAGNQTRPIRITTGRTVWREDLRVGNSILVTTRDGVFSQERMNLIEITHFINTGTVRVMLNNFNYSFDDLYRNLVLRLKKIEERTRSTGEFITKYIFFGVDFTVAIDDLTIEDQRIGNHFTLDHPINGELDSAVFELDTGLGTLTEQFRVLPHKIGNKYVYREYLAFDERINLSNTTATVDLINHTITFTDGEVFETNAIYKFDNTVPQFFKPIIPTTTGAGSLALTVSGDNGDNFQNATNNLREEIVNRGTGGAILRMVASGNVTLSIINNNFYVPISGEIELEE